MSRFDPIDGADYGACDDCGITLPTEQAAKDHRAATMSPGKSSHRTRASNPTRVDRIQSHVDGVVEDAISEALDDLRNEVGRANVTWDEIHEALKWHSEFADEWEKQS
ncbi:hypothetical protein [Microbacterium sp. UCD-TDU]|uniref:hypothetical protein n=1 Tax=Microbacterium sp. UCD-TDU TaxID=1247714 RepID=UPI000345B493|nr:hypothetical protein [Microbacterium sp. UCD-TDU]EYT61643.1 hypothetical protein D514_0102245 [Microbacterium sp. UCD-TDU]